MSKSIIDQIKDALFYKAGTTGDNKELDLKKLAGLLGFGLTASGAIDFGPETPAVGYNKPVPKFNAVRNRVQNTYDPNRRPGSGGQYFFTPTEYVQQSDSLFGDDFESYADDLQTAQDAAATQAKGLETLNKENLASYPSPVVTTPEETNTGIASLPSIPTAEEQLAGQVNIGMANGGIVGLSHGGFHLTQPSTWGSAASNLGSNIKDTVSSIFSGNDNNDNSSTSIFAPANTHSNITSLEDAKAYREAGGTDTGFGNVLSTDDLKSVFTGGDAGNQHLRNYDLFNTTEDLRPDGTSRDRDINDVNYNTEYNKAVASLGDSAINKHARATSFMGGSDYDTTAARAEAGADIDMGVYNNELVGMPVTTMFHGIPITQTVVGYNDENGVFRAVLPDDAKTALAQGNVTMLNNAQEMDEYRNPTTPTGSDGSTAGGDGSTSANVWSAETYPVVTNIFSSLGQAIPTTVNSFDQKSTDNLISAITNFAAIDTVEKQTSDIQYYESIANNTVAEDYPNETINGVPASEYFAEFTDKQRQSYQNLADFYKKLQELGLDEEDLNTAIQELKTWSDFLGTYGQPGAGGAAYGGAIKGYAMGGMGQAPNLPSGLLKSTEDGMADTIPAQMGNQPINLSGGEYIMDAETVAFLGNGNTDSGAQKLDDFRENLRMAKNGGEDQGNQINPENFLGRLQQMGVA